MADRDTAIREQIQRFIAGKLAVIELAEWLQDETWDIDSESAATRRLAHDAGRLFDEWEHGDWTEAELKERLGVLNRTYWFDNAVRTVFPGSVSALIRADRRQVATGRSLVVESA